MEWIYLVIAGLFEIAWPVGLKIAHTHKFWGTATAAITMIISGFFLYLAQKTIPIGTAYAVWTGIGAAGAMVVGVIFWSDPLTLWRILGVMLIIGGVLMLKMAT
ncbi:MAG: DMT family transporter [Limisphaerales bacterium]|jgi:quaternary ammonium compound-resistance protein SugE|nr:multidrug efflux SMR transporter [Verrucomicrobiota bacterium]